MADSVVIVQPGSVPSVVVAPPTPSPTASSSVVVSGTSVGPQGPAGPAGPAGPVGATGGSYTHNQSTASTIWTITHNLGFNPNVTVVASSGGVVEGDTFWPSINTVTITFSAAFSGVAYLS